MISQKEALKNALDGLPHDFRLIYIGNWLEDINWHSEAAIIRAIPFRNTAKMNWLEEMKYVNDPAGYAYEYVQEQIKTVDPLMLSQLMEIKSGRKVSIAYKGDQFLVTPSDLHDLIRAENYSPFSYIFGWGLDNDCWKATQGQEFVNELLDIVKQTEAVNA